MLYSGVKIWSYFSKGYGWSNSSSKKANPFLVQSKMLSASRCWVSDLRQNTPSGTTPLRVCTSSRTSSYGPAMRAVMYEEIRWVGSNDHVARSTPSATPAASGLGVGELL